MANICDVYVEFYNVKDEQKHLITEENFKNEEIKTNNDSWVDIEFVNEGLNTLSMSSAWSAPTSWFEGFCAEHGLEGRMYFYEPGCCYHGYADVTDGHIQTTYYDNNFEYLYLHNNEGFWDEVNYFLEEDMLEEEEWNERVLKYVSFEDKKKLIEMIEKQKKG